MNLVLIQLLTPRFIIYFSFYADNRYNMQKCNRATFVCSEYSLTIILTISSGGIQIFFRSRKINLTLSQSKRKYANKLIMKEKKYIMQKVTYPAAKVVMCLRFICNLIWQNAGDLSPTAYTTDCTHYECDWHCTVGLPALRIAYTIRITPIIRHRDSLAWPPIDAMNMVVGCRTSDVWAKTFVCTELKHSYKLFSYWNH